MDVGELRTYLESHYEASAFDQALSSGEVWILYCHGLKTFRGIIKKNEKYDVTVEDVSLGEQGIRKVEIKYLYPESKESLVTKLIKRDEKILHPPIEEKARRRHIKNKTLFPLMKNREVVFLQTLEGELIRGLVDEFSRYEIVVKLKNGAPVTVLRHCVYDFWNKAGVHLLKSDLKKKSGAK